MKTAPNLKTICVRALINLSDGGRLVRKNEEFFITPERLRIIRNQVEVIKYPTKQENREIKDLIPTKTTMMNTPRQKGCKTCGKKR